MNLQPPRFLTYRVLFTAIAGLFVATVVTAFTLAQTGTRIAAQHAPLVHATMDVKYHVSLFHAVFDELMAGDPSRSLNTIWRHWDEAAQYARAMRYGGETPQGTVVPLSHPELREAAEVVLADLVRLRSAAGARFESPGMGAAGAGFDDEIDGAVAAVIEDTDRIETALLRRIADDSYVSRTASLGLAGLAVLLGLVMGALIYRYETRRIAQTNALRASEGRLQAIRQSTPDAMVTIDAEGKIVAWNRAAERIFGHAEGSILGKPVTTLVPERHLETHRRRFAGVLSGGDSHIIGKTVELTGRRRDGSEFPLEMSLSTWTAGEDSFFSGIIRDITARKSAENRLARTVDALRRRNDEIEALLAGTRAILETTDFEDAAKRIFHACAKAIGAPAGYVALLSADGSRNEVVFVETGGAPCTLDPNLPMPLRGLRAEACERGETVYDNDFGQREWPESLPQDHVAPDNAMFAPLMIENTAVGFMGFANKPGGFSDDDARLASAFAEYATIALRRARNLEALRESDERFRQALYDMPVIVNAFDADGKILVWNREAERVTGYRAAEMVNDTRPLETLYPDAATRRRMLARWRTQKDGFRGWECRLKAKDGSNRTIAWSNISRSFPVPGWASWSIGIDVTERKKAEKERAKMEQRLRQAHKMEALGSLSGGIAHDLNNILTPILGLTKLTLKTLPAEGPGRSNLEGVLTAGERAKELVEKILAFSREGPAELQCIDISSAVDEALRLLRLSLVPTVELRLDIDPDAGFIRAESAEIHQIIMNLGVNAADAMNNKGVLEVALDRVEFSDGGLPDPSLEPGGYVRLRMRDTGCGMDKRTQRRIFDPFFTTKPVGEGTGMGLSVVHGIVAGYGGAITVSSAPGKGTTFAVYFPSCDEMAHVSAAEGESQETAGMPPTASGGNGRSRRRGPKRGAPIPLE